MPDRIQLDDQGERHLTGAAGVLPIATAGTGRQLSWRGAEHHVGLLVTSAGGVHDIARTVIGGAAAVGWRVLLLCLDDDLDSAVLDQFPHQVASAVTVTHATTDADLDQILGRLRTAALASISDRFAGRAQDTVRTLLVVIGRGSRVARSTDVVLAHLALIGQIAGLHPILVAVDAVDLPDLTGWVSLRVAHRLPGPVNVAAALAVPVADADGSDTWIADRGTGVPAQLNQPEWAQ